MARVEERAEATFTNTVTMDKTLAVTGVVTAATGVTVTTGGATVTAGGLTVTAGNVAFKENHPLIRHQGTQATTADSTAVISHGDVKAQIIQCTPASGGLTKPTDTAANYIANLDLSSDGDSVDFYFINLATTITFIVSLTAGTGVTLVGSMMCHPDVVAEDTSGSTMFRLRRTGAAACTLYRLS